MQTFVAVLALAAVAAASPFVPCDTTRGTITKVEIDGCGDTVQRCILHKGTDAKITITFTPAEDSDKVSVKAYGIIAGVPIPYPLPNTDACAGGVNCPLKNGQSAVYSQSFKVQPAYPSLSLDVKWTLVDGSGYEIICAKIPVEIQ